MDARLAAMWDDFGRRWAHGTSPLYEEWAVGVAADPEVLALIAALPPAKRQPNLVFAAARWVGAPLVRYPAWRDWLIAHWPDMREVMLVRSTQTNEPNRCATLLPVLAGIDGPVALLEVGASAGLCLLPDRYGYRYEVPDGEHRLGADEPVMVCRMTGAPAPDRLPEVVWRRGIDLHPLDVTDPDAVRWLETLVWPGPDHDARVARLAGAAAVAASDPPEVVAGDLLTRLEDVAAASPADATLVVFHSAVLVYLDRADRDRVVELVRGLGRRIDRRVVWLAQETRSVLDLPAPAVESSGRFLQRVDGEVVALAGQHGATYERLVSTR